MDRKEAQTIISLRVGYLYLLIYYHPTLPSVFPSGSLHIYFSKHKKHRVPIIVSPTDYFPGAYIRPFHQAHSKMCLTVPRSKEQSEAAPKGPRPAPTGLGAPTERKLCGVCLADIVYTLEPCAKHVSYPRSPTTLWNIFSRLMNMRRRVLVTKEAVLVLVVAADP